MLDCVNGVTKGTWVNPDTISVPSPVPTKLKGAALGTPEKVMFWKRDDEAIAVMLTVALGGTKNVMGLLMLEGVLRIVAS